MRGFIAVAKLLAPAQLFALCISLSPSPGQDAAGDTVKPTPIYTIGHGVTAPEVLLPSSNSVAKVNGRKAKFEGTIKLTLFVDSKGLPSDIRIVRALGMGLDLTVLKMVAAERFRPSMLNGQAVAVGVTLEVTLPIYGETQEDLNGKKPVIFAVGVPTAQIFSDWPGKPKEAKLGLAPVCCGVL